MTQEFNSAVESLKRAEQAALAELQRIRLALANLTGERAGTPAVDSAGYEGLGITAATKRYLERVGQPKSTKEIADELLRGGVKTKSRRFVPAVYATLSNSKLFVRKGEVWDLRDRA